MGLGFAIANAIPAAVTAYLCLLAPAQAWWRGSAPTLPRLFVRIGLSALWTTCLGILLALLDAFSVPLLVLINAAVTLFGYLWVVLPRREGLLIPQRAGAGALVAVAAVAFSWPSYDARVAGSDSTTYIAAGSHLARNHQLWKDDVEGGVLSAHVRERLFLSVFVLPPVPPFSRVPGGIVLDARDSTEARPSFFPVPIVWSGLSAYTLGTRHAGAFAGLFTALAAWAVYVVAARRMSAPAAVAAAVFAAANYGSYFVSKLALSEPIAGFFLWSGIAALDAWDEDGFPADALLAGLWLGCATLVRIEIAAFLLCVMAIRRAMRPGSAARPLGSPFYLGTILMLSLVAAELAYAPGAYTAPIDAATRFIRNTAIDWSEAASAPAIAAAGVAVVAAAAAGLMLVSRLGVVRGSCALLAAGMVGAYTLAAFHSQFFRSVGWIADMLGFASVPALAEFTYEAPIRKALLCPAILLGLHGLRVAWRERYESPGNAVLVAIACLFGGLLLYNPQVYPSLPVAGRRFVPLVIPAIILFACLSADRVGRRSTIAGAAAWLLLTAGIAIPAKNVWGVEYYKGAGKQLEEFVAKLPRDAVFLLDSSMNPFVLGIPMWLNYDRPNLPVTLASTYGATAASLATLELIESGRKVYLIRSALSDEPRFVGVERELTDDYVFEIGLPRQTVYTLSVNKSLYTSTVAVDRLTADGSLTADTLRTWIENQQRLAQERLS